ncbi:MAG: bifunctional D-glycero-beta-D-manno-heptose-7-phosphate kinase/D-glycero-beta-D-manno-heptose 1-phosphate adenylyltransferase HldE [Bacillota bacterium]
MFNHPDKIKEFLSQNTFPQKIMVIGDIILDKYYYGEVKRISPEAPVPVTKVSRETNTLGGAANVAHNLANLGFKVFLLGLTGDDDNRRSLINLLEAKNIDYQGILVSSVPTTTKIRVIGAHQQMLRLDFEADSINDGLAENRLKEWFSMNLSVIDAVIISDYAKGVCTENFCRHVIEECNKREIPVLVDPKGSNWRKYSGATFITPNIKELSEAVNIKVKNEDSEVEKYSREIKDRLNFENIVVTRSEKGLSLLNDNKAMHIPTLAKEVFDVSGAGDTVAAVLFAAYVTGIQPCDAAQLANIAAGVVVGKVGTYAITKYEISEAVYQLTNQQGANQKIVGLNEALRLVETWRKKGYRIVFTNGCFDILHVGHVVYLEKALNLGDRLIIGLNSDSSVQRLKGKGRPIVKERDRARLLAGLECVSCVVLFNEDTPAELIKAIKPDILVKGGDYRPEEVVGREDAGRVEIIPFEQGYSTTNIIEEVLRKYNG